MIKSVMNEDDFEKAVERYGVTEDQLIETMVSEGWTIGKEIDTHAANYPYGNLYFPPELEEGEKA